MKKAKLFLSLTAMVLAIPRMSFAGETGVVEFRILEGTGKKPWNNRQNPVEIKVGQVLRIINDDTVPHRLHTFDDKPCAHQPSNSLPGQWYDCTISTPIDPDVDLLYDHNFGITSRFYLRATN